jgi:hypothetical protein
MIFCMWLLSHNGNLTAQYKYLDTTEILIRSETSNVYVSSTGWVKWTRGSFCSSSSEVKPITDMWNPNCFIKWSDILQISFVKESTTWSMKTDMYLQITW